MTPFPQRWTFFDILRWTVVCLGIFWLVSGFLAIITPWWLAREVVRLSLAPFNAFLIWSRYGRILDDSNMEVFVFYYAPNGRLPYTTSAIGMGMMGVGLAMALAPNILIHRLRHEPSIRLTRAE